MAWNKISYKKLQWKFNFFLKKQCMYIHVCTCVSFLFCLLTPTDRLDQLGLFLTYLSPTWTFLPPCHPQMMSFLYLGSKFLLRHWKRWCSFKTVYMAHTLALIFSQSVGFCKLVHRLSFLLRCGSSGQMCCICILASCAANSM